MATSKRITPRKLTAAPNLSAKGRKTVAWLDDMYNGPVTLTRKQFDAVYKAVLFAANTRQNEIESHTPVDDEEWEETKGVLGAAEAEFCILNRLLFQLENHIHPNTRPLRYFARRAA